MRRIAANVGLVAILLAEMALWLLGITYPVFKAPLIGAVIRKAVEEFRALHIGHKFPTFGVIDEWPVEKGILCQLK